jgi:hypothetical protein
MPTMYRHFLRSILAAVIGAIAFMFLPTASAKAEAPAGQSPEQPPDTDTIAALRQSGSGKTPYKVSVIYLTV